MTRTSAELEIVPCNYIILSKSAKVTAKESNLYTIEFCWIQATKQTAQTTIPFSV